MKSYVEGIQKVRESDGKYAFALSRTMAKFAVGTPPCELMMVGKFAEQSSALVIRKGDPFKTQLNDAISELKKNGVFDEISKKWFVVPCHDKSTTSGAGPAAASIVDSIALAYLLSAFF